MPSKTEIKANKAEAKKLIRTLAQKDREKLRAIKKQRTIIKKAERIIDLEELRANLLTKKINRRLAILEGRNEA